MRTRAAIPARSASISPRSAFPLLWPRRKSTSPALRDLRRTTGSGVGGTADYNTFQYASENSDANASVTKVWGKHEISTGFEYMKRFLNVGQPPAPSGSYGFDISATDQATGAQSPLGGSDFASFLLGMGTTPGTESNDYPNFTKDFFAAEANPYYAAFVEDTWHPGQDLHHYCRACAGISLADEPSGITAWNTSTPAVTNTSMASPIPAQKSTSTAAIALPYNQPHELRAAPGLRLAAVRTYWSFAAAQASITAPVRRWSAAPGWTATASPPLQHWNATCYNADGNTSTTARPACVGAAPGDPVVSSNAAGLYAGSYSLSNPFPNGVVPRLPIAYRAGQQPWQHIEHRAALAAHAHDL